MTKLGLHVNTLQTQLTLPSDVNLQCNDSINSVTDITEVGPILAFLCTAAVSLIEAVQCVFYTIVSQI